jgi:subtilisin family serine protease
MMRTLLAVALFAAAATTAQAAERPIIATRSDLPPTRFTFAAPPSALMDKPEFAAMLPAIRSEAERLLRDYDIRDATIKADLAFGLAAIAVLDGRKADADRFVANYRALQTKPQGKAIGALSMDLAAATLAPGGGCDAAAARLTERLRDVDPVTVRDQILQSYSGLQTVSVAFMAGTAVGLFDPVVKERGSLDVLQAIRLAAFRALATKIPPCRAPLVAAARAWIDAPANRPVDIWQDRQPPAAAFATARPVTVAVWDSGFDETLFPGQLAQDPAEPLDGIDNDGNGVIDDTNGPTYDTALKPRAGAIMQPTQWLRTRLGSTVALAKGELDLNYGLDTPEATLFASFSRSASSREQGDAFLAVLENGGRVHGTACASEIADGAPYVRLYNIAALPWGRDENREDIPYDEATVTRWAAAIDRLAARLKGADVRIVSMSWGLTADEITEELLDHKLETDPAKAKARGIAMQKTIGDALERLLRAASNTLFVVAAGNSNQADDVQSDSVQRLKLPNLIIVGATGTNGRPTNFTVFGPSIGVYAQGEAVPLRWPGDIAVHMSGTSMAAPLVARAAAQMVAVNAKLTAAQMRIGLVETATGEVKLLHPAAAVAWAVRH